MPTSLIVFALSVALVDQIGSGGCPWLLLSGRLRQVLGYLLDQSFENSDYYFPLPSYLLPVKGLHCSVHHGALKMDWLSFDASGNPYHCWKL